jgi:DNA mismatch endonuclease, patch repair protein
VADVHDVATRSRNMAAIRATNTKPELLVRRTLHAFGLRYRLHARELPGKPDLVFPRYKAVIFVHGCFWHGHDCHLFTMPATRRDFWEAKISRNVTNDEKAGAALRSAGWRIGVVWECALKGRTRLDFTQAMQALANWVRSAEPSITLRGN